MRLRKPAAVSRSIVRDFKKKSSRDRNHLTRLFFSFLQWTQSTGLSGKAPELEGEKQRTTFITFINSFRVLYEEVLSLLKALLFERFRRWFGIIWNQREISRIEVLS